MAIVGNGNRMYRYEQKTYLINKYIMKDIFF